MALLRCYTIEFPYVIYLYTSLAPDVSPTLGVLLTSFAKL